MKHNYEIERNGCVFTKFQIESLSPIFYDIFYGNTDNVKKYLASEEFPFKTSEIQVESKTNLNILEFAIASYVPEIIELILKDGRVLPSENNFRAFMIACQHGQIDTIKKIVACDKQAMYAKDGEGCTALLHAVLFGDKNVVQWILDYAPDLVNCLDNSRQSIVTYAASCGHVNILDLLWKKLKPKKLNQLMSYPNVSSMTPVLVAAKLGEQDALEWLLRHNLNSINHKDHRGYSLLMIAAEYGHLHVVRWLLRHNPISINDKDLRGYSILMLAAESGRRNVVDWILNNIKNLATDDEVGNNQIFRDHFGYNILMVSAFCGHSSIVKDILDMFPALRIWRDKNNQTCLHWAVLGNNPSVVRQIYNTLPANFIIQSSSGKTPLEYAVQNGHLKVLQLFNELRPGCIYFKNRQGISPLHYGLAYGQFEVVRWLFEQNCHTNSSIRISVSKLKELNQRPKFLFQYFNLLIDYPEKFKSLSKCLNLFQFSEALQKEGASAEAAHYLVELLASNVPLKQKHVYSIARYWKYSLFEYILSLEPTKKLIFLEHVVQTGTNLNVFFKYQTSYFFGDGLYPKLKNEYKLLTASQSNYIDKIFYLPLANEGDALAINTCAADMPYMPK